MSGNNSQAPTNAIGQNSPQVGKNAQELSPIGAAIEAKLAAKAKGKRGGRPKLQDDSKLPQDQARVIKRQRRDCERLASIVEAAGEGSHDPAAAGQLSRAMATLHDLERDAYGLRQGAKGIQAVIMIPTPAETVEKWVVMVGDALGGGPVEVPKDLRRVEADVYGDPDDDQETGGGGSGA